MNIKANGIRRAYLDDLKDERSMYPRAKLSRKLGFYMDRKNLSRPLFAFHQLARISELFLYRAKYGRPACRDHLERVECFFVDVRRVQRNILSQYRVEKPIPRDATPELRNKAKDLFEEAERLGELLSKAKLTVCPVCRGIGKITRADYEWVKNLLDRMVAEGRIKRSDIPTPLSF